MIKSNHKLPPLYRRRSKFANIYDIIDRMELNGEPGVGQQLTADDISAVRNGITRYTKAGRWPNAYIQTTAEWLGNGRYYLWMYKKDKS